jgi:hypothetical protein
MSGTISAILARTCSNSRERLQHAEHAGQRRAALADGTAIPLVGASGYEAVAAARTATGPGLGSRSCAGCPPFTR